MKLSRIRKALGAAGGGFVGGVGIYLKTADHLALDAKTVGAAVGAGVTGAVAAFLAAYFAPANAPAA